MDTALVRTQYPIATIPRGGQRRQQEYSVVEILHPPVAEPIMIRHLAVALRPALGTPEVYGFPRTLWATEVGQYVDVWV